MKLFQKTRDTLTRLLGRVVITEDGDKVKELKRQIRIMQESLERKNKELDAMHYVWCNGGCPGGVHRHTKTKLTEDVVLEAERNTKRLRQWYESNQYRNK